MDWKPPFRFFDDSDLAVANLADAIPRPDEEYKSTVEIWSASKYPKLTYANTRKTLNGLVKNGFVKKLGNKHGVQYYKLVDESVFI